MILFALRMYRSAKGNSAYEKYTGVEPNTTKKLLRRDRLKSAPYLRLKIFKEQLLETFGKIIFFKKNFENFFFGKSIFLESRTIPKNSKRGHSGSLNVFTNRKLHKMQWVTL